MQSIKNTFPKGLVHASLLTIIAWGVYQAQPFLIPLCIASLVALTLAPWIKLMRRLRFPEWLAISCSVILLILPFATVGYIFILQSQSLLHDIPLIFKTLDRMTQGFLDSSIGMKLHLGHEFHISQLFEKLEGSAIQGIQFAVTGLRAVLEAGSQVILVGFYGVLMVASRSHLRKSAEKILKHSFEMENTVLLDEAISLIESFLISRLLIVLIVAGVDTLILSAFNIRYAILLGSFLGIMTLIPAIGFLIGAAFPILVAIASGFSFFKILFLFSALFMMSIIEGNYLTPKMVGKRLNINVLSTFVGLLAGGLFWGIWGMFLSIPVLGIARILFAATPSLKPWSELLADKNGDIELHLPQKTGKKVA